MELEQYIMCPACEQETLDPVKINNAMSRYAKGIYICSDCGMREAMEGNFWKEQQIFYSSFV